MTDRILPTVLRAAADGDTMIPTLLLLFALPLLIIAAWAVLAGLRRQLLQKKLFYLVSLGVSLLAIAVALALVQLGAMVGTRSSDDAGMAFIAGILLVNGYAGFFVALMLWPFALLMREREPRSVFAAGAPQYRRSSALPAALLAGGGTVAAASPADAITLGATNNPVSTNSPADTNSPVSTNSPADINSPVSTNSPDGTGSSAAPDSLAAPNGPGTGVSAGAGSAAGGAGISGERGARFETRRSRRDGVALSDGQTVETG
ncbi:hypothetical protein [Compostimonas suwonensis]|uniref:Uncharacterized protein n=1 Tax=Compostimonas suwonensis TaxID=1048394 RepID=A0A2M9BVR7_9MICO|nr:hypothetical protein [Compostimonas suwonensis]PJJ62025.1 hypothetical protein CLV54_1817 [Compostimonas suwonensis]